MNPSPLLTGADADRARAAVRRFSSALLSCGSCDARSTHDLATGMAGHALVHAGLERALPGLGHAERAQSALSGAIAALASVATTACLGSGVVGVAWTTDLLAGSEPASDDDDVDAALEAMLAVRPWRGPYDLLGGLTGSAVYALERLPRPSAHRLVASVVSALADRATQVPEGVAWRSDEELVAEEPRWPNYVEWNLGAAHGVPGVIAVLGRVCASEADAATRTQARTLLNGAVRWLLAQELPADAGGGFAVGVGRDAPKVRGRCAWCYGELGLAAALMVAARAVGEGAWVREATRVGLHAAARAESDCGVTDAGLCHGAAGLGHIYHRLHRATGDERFATAARSWLRKALDMQDDAAALVWTAHEEGRATSTPAFLAGAGGVALALLAATGDADASWDRALGLSGREGALADE